MFTHRATKRKFGKNLSEQLAKESLQKRLFKEARAKKKVRYEPKSYVPEDENEEMNEYWRSRDEEDFWKDYNWYDYDCDWFDQFDDERRTISCYCKYCY